MERKFEGVGGERPGTTSNISQSPWGSCLLPKCLCHHLKINKINNTISPSFSREFIKMACVCTELDPWPPSLIIIVKSIGKEILSAAITKVKKAYGGQGLASLWAFSPSC